MSRWKHPEPVQVRRRSQVGTDRGGNPVWEFVDHGEPLLCAVAPKIGKDLIESYSDGVEHGFDVYLPKESGVLRTDRVMVRGVECVIDGVPAEWRNPHNDLHPGGHISVKRWEGG